jgi:hypothetical protein
MKNEIDFALSLCQFLEPDEEKIKSLIKAGLDYPYVLGQLLFNRVGGAAYYTLDKLSLLGKMNREFKNTLKTIYDTNVIKSESLKKSLNYLGEIFKDAGFPYALLKGSYLVNLYPIGLRTSNDIDILSNFDDSTKISKLLLENGFVQGNVRNGEIVKATRAEIISSQINRGETVPFVKEINLPYMRFLEIDVNFSLDFKPERNKSIVGKLLENAVPNIKTVGGTLFTLSPADFLIQLCVHLYKEASVYSWVEFGRDQGLYKYLDIYLFILTFPDTIASASLAEKIKAFEIEKECFYALNGARELFSSCDTLELNILLNAIKPQDTGFLNEIISPADNKIYRYDVGFKDWIFCGKRRELLYEVKN